MKKLMLLVAMVFATVSMSFANSAYELNDDAIDAAFERSEEVVSNDFQTETTSMESSVLDLSNIKSAKDDKSAILAGVLCFGGAFFLGIAGIHRLYLEGGIGVFIGYFCTAGGFGCLTLIDSYILFFKAPKDGLGSYIGCSRFFMWTCD